MDKIVFYKERAFGEKFNVTFEFVRQNWKLLLRYVSYVILPLCFVGAMSLDTLVKNITSVYAAADEFEVFHFVGSYAVTMLVLLLGSLWLATVTYSLMQAYNERSNGLEDITFQELKPLLKRNAWRLVKCGLVTSLLVVAVVALFIFFAALIHWSMVLLALVALLVLAIPLLMIPPVYIYEDVSVWKACSRGFFLGWKTWGGIFALGFVLVLLSNVAVSVLSLPWEVCYIAQTLFAQSGTSDAVITSSVWFMLLQYVFCIIMLYAQFVVYSLFYVSCSYLYSHAAEQQDDMSLETGISHFTELADNHEDADDIWS